MKIVIKPGKYVLAVSGGVDSVVLLDILSRKQNIDLVVAHFDHGIRSDSASDCKFVEDLASQYGHKFIYKEGKLGPNASEALARNKRYEFLEYAKNKFGAAAIITAHHQDDLLETAIINLIRGTNRRGLSSISSTKDIVRPLLHLTKLEIKNYARGKNLVWREDSTNQDEKYLRNYIRLNIMPNLSKAKRTELLNIVDSAKVSNQEINSLLENLLASQPNQSSINRYWFTSLPHSVAKEIMSSWLTSNSVELDKKRVEEMTLAAKTLLPGKKRDVDNTHILEIRRKDLALVTRER